MMPLPHRSLHHPLALGLAAVFLAAAGSLNAQSQLRSKLIERTRERQNSAVENRLAQNEKNQLQSVTEQLPESVRENETAKAISSRMSEELKGKSTEEVIRAAQERIRRSKEGAPPAPATITDTTAKPAANANAKTNPGPRTMIPEPTASARPVAAPATAAPGQAPPAGQLVTQASPTPAPTPPPGIGSTAPAPIPLKPRYENAKSGASQVMEIESDESVMDNENRLITFTGSVVVTEPRFTLTSDRLDVYMNDDTNLDGSPAAGAAANDGEDKPPFKRAIATGGMVEIEKIGADGKIQIAKARKADYDAATGDITLSGGPPTLQSGTGFVNPSSPDAVIILRADGNHQINGGSGGRNKISIPLKGNAANAAPTGGGAPLSGSLNTITNRNKSR